MYALAIPKWGIEMETGTITNWHSDVGDSVTKGDELVDIESDKIVNTLEATGTGVLRRKLVDEDESLGVGELIGVIADADATDEDIDAFIADFSVGAGDSSEANSEAADQNESVAKTDQPAAVSAPASGKVRVSTPVKRKAEQLGIDLATIVGTGPNGRITAVDVDLAASGGTANDAKASTANVVADNYTVSKLSSTQQTIGKRLVESKQSVPHFYLNIDIELDALLTKRAVINAKQAQKVSINDMIVWGTAQALLVVPEINAQLVDNEIRQFQHADISVAVSTERGLLTPIVKAADQMTPEQISTAISELVDKAKNGGLEKSDISGGSFTVSNLGMFGVKSFDAIINPPQVAILALGRAQKQLLVRDDDQSVVATVVSASLSSDHRVVDGALGGKFLSELKKIIESTA